MGLARILYQRQQEGLHLSDYLVLLVKKDIVGRVEHYEPTMWQLALGIFADGSLNSEEPLHNR